MSGRIDSPTHGWASVENRHGRLVWRGDDEPTAPDAWESPLWAQKAAEMEMSRRRKMRVLKWLLLVFAACLLGGFIAGCAHREEAPAKVVLPEKAGSLAAKVIRAVTGQEPKAAAVPGGPVVIFQPADAEDVCLWAHELVHRDDQERMGSVAWVSEYAAQYAECRKGGYSSAWCLRSIDLELSAYRRQHECAAARANGRPWPPLSERRRLRGEWPLCKRGGP